jgi:hypothetical protein
MQERVGCARSGFASSAEMQRQEHLFIVDVDTLNVRTPTGLGFDIALGIVRRMAKSSPWRATSLSAALFLPTSPSVSPTANKVRVT